MSRHGLFKLGGACALLAVAEAWRLSREEGVPSRVLWYLLPEHKVFHAQLLYQSPTGEYFSYVPELGSLSLGRLSGAQTTPLEAARAIDPTAEQAEWKTDYNSKLIKKAQLLAQISELKKTHMDAAEKMRLESERFLEELKERFT